MISRSFDMVVSPYAFVPPPACAGGRPQPTPMRPGSQSGFPAGRVMEWRTSAPPPCHALTPHLCCEQKHLISYKVSKLGMINIHLLTSSIRRLAPVAFGRLGAVRPGARISRGATDAVAGG